MSKEDDVKRPVHTGFKKRLKNISKLKRNGSANKTSKEVRVISICLKRFSSPLYCFKYI